MVSVIRGDDNFDSAGVFGGQTWQDVLSSRSVNTTYQNTTDKPIVVSIYGNGDDGTTSFAPNSSTAVFQISTDGSTWVDVMDAFLERTGSGSSYARVINLSVVVPAGHYYRIDVQYSWSATHRWAELR